MYGYNNTKSGPLSGLNPRETSWRTYSKSLIVELKEKLAARRARTLALLSENGDLTAFNEIDTESDGLDDTSTDITNDPDQLRKEGTATHGQAGEKNSVSEVSSLTESDYNDVDIHDEQSKNSAEIPIVVNSKCCSGSCSTITSVSGGSYTSEDVSSRSLDDFVADMNVVEDTKTGNYPCPHSPDITCSMYLAGTKIIDKYTIESSQEEGYQTCLCKLYERNVTTTVSKASLHFQYNLSAHMSPQSINFDNEAVLLKAKSDTLLCVAMQSETNCLHSHSNAAGLLMISMLTGMQTTSLRSTTSKESSSSLGPFSSQVVQNLDNKQVQGETLNEKSYTSMKQTVFGNLITQKEGIRDTSYKIDENLELEEYYLSEELEELTEYKEEEDEENNEMTVKKSEEHTEVMEQDGEKEVNEHEFGEEMKTEVETQVQQEDKMFNLQHNGIGRTSQDKDNDAMTFEDYIERITSDEKENLPGANVCYIDSNDSDSSSRNDKQEEESSIMNEDDPKPLLDVKNMLDELVNIFESNLQFYNSVDKSIITMFENHSADFNMMVSAYNNKSGNSGYAETGKQTTGQRSLQSRLSDSSQTDTSPKLDIQNQSLQECLEKARLANNLQDTVYSTKDKTDNVTAIKTYQQTVAELEKSMLDYLQVYAKEAVDDVSNYHSELEENCESTAKHQHHLEQNKQNVLRRSDTFVLKDQCTGKPPNNATRRRSSGFLKTGTITNIKHTDKGAREEAGESKSEESPKAPHSSPTFLITDDFWNKCSGLLETPKLDYNLQDRAIVLDDNIGGGNVDRKEHQNMAGPSCKDDDFSSDSTESLSETKETENVTYTSTMLTQLLDYNSADETRTLREREELEDGQELKGTKNSKLNFENTNNEQPAVLETNYRSSKKSKTCYVNDTDKNVENDPLCRMATMASTQVKLFLHDNNIKDRHLEILDVEDAIDLNTEDTDQEDNTSNVKKISEQSQHHEHSSHVLKNINVDAHILITDARKYQEKTSASQEHYKKQLSPLPTPREHKGTQRISELSCVNEGTCTVIHKRTNTRDTSPLEKARPDNAFSQNICSKYSGTSGTSNEFSGNNFNYPVLGQDGQPFHKKWNLPKKLREESLDDLCPRALVANIDWSSSDEDPVDDIQLDVSPSDLLRQKQKRDVNEKLMQLEQFSRRKRKSRSPLRHKTASDIPSWIHSKETHHQTNLRLGASNLIADTRDRTYVNNKYAKQELKKFSSLPREFDTVALNYACFTTQESDDTELYMSASQLLIARNQEEKNVTDSHGIVATRNQEEKNVTDSHGIAATRNREEKNVTDSLGIVATRNQEEKNVADSHGIVATRNQEEKNVTDSHGIVATRNQEERNVADSHGIVAIRNQDEKNVTDSHGIAAKEKTQDFNINQEKATNIYERSKDSEINSELHSECLFDNYEEGQCDEFSKRSASTNSKKYTDPIMESHNAAANKNEDAIMDNGSNDNDCLEITCKLLDDSKDELKPVQQEAISTALSVDTNVSMGCYTDGFCCHMYPHCPHTIALDQSNILDIGHVDKNSRELGEGTCRLYGGESRLKMDNYHPCHKKQQPAGNLCKDIPLDQLHIDDLLPCVCAPSSDNDHLQHVPTSYLENFLDKRKQSEGAQEEKYHTKMNMKPNFDRRSDYAIKGNTELHKSNQEKTYSVMRPGQTSSGSDLQKRDNVVSDNLLCEQADFGSLSTDMLHVGKRNSLENPRSAFQVTLQHNTLNQLDVTNECLHMPVYGDHTTSPIVDIQPEYYAIDALRYKVNCLEQMLGHGDIINDNFHRRNIHCLNTSVLTTSGKSMNCLCCQQSIEGNSLGKTHFQPIREQDLQSLCYGHVNEQKYHEQSLLERNLSPICSCRRRSCLHVHDDSNRRYQNRVNRENVSSKECQTVGEWTQGNCNSKPRPYVDSYTQGDSSLDPAVWTSLEDRMAVMDQSIQEIKHYEDCANKLMTDLDLRMNRFAESTATSLDGHRKQLENSQIFVSEGFKSLEDKIQQQNNTFKSTRDYLTVTEQNWETVIQTLKCQHMDIVSRSIQTVEEKLCPLKEFIDVQKKEIEEIKTSLQNVVSCLESKGSELTKKSMSSDLMKERIIDITSQRDSEKVFHRITRQSLRALERDHDRLRQEYIRATCRRNNYVCNNTDSDVRNRLWYYLNNQERYQPCNNNHSSARETYPRSETWSPLCGSGEEEDDSFNQSERTSGNRHRSHRNHKRCNPDCHRLPHCSCAQADNVKNNAIPQENNRTTTNRSKFKCTSTQSTLRKQPNRTQEVAESTLLISEHSQNLASPQTTSCFPSQEGNNVDLRESDLG